MFCSIGQGLDGSLDMRGRYLCADPMFICSTAGALEYAQIEAALFRSICGWVALCQLACLEYAKVDFLWGRVEVFVDTHRAL
jgi:hypothetical protein